MIAAVPSIALEGLAVGVDNLRHDVALSQGFVEAARAQVMRLIVRHGELEGLLAAEATQKTPGPLVDEKRRRRPNPQSNGKIRLEVAADRTASGRLNRAKKEENISVDLLARLAVTKFLRTEMNLQFAQVLERCRVLLKSYEGIRQGKAVEYRERVAAFQVRKKIILRKTGQDLFETLREIEKETLARMRRSLFGEAKTAEAKTAESKDWRSKASEPGQRRPWQLRPVPEPPRIFRGWPRRLPLCRTLRDARQLGSRSRPLSSICKIGVGFLAFAIRRRDDERNHRLLAMRSGECARPRWHRNAR